MPMPSARNTDISTSRHEYPLAVKNLGIAIKQARAMGLLGKNILGSEL